MSIDQFRNFTPGCPSYKSILWRRPRALAREIPNPKLQPPKKHQIPSFKHAAPAPFGAWKLELSWDFGFGAWDFSRDVSEQRQKPRLATLNYHRPWNLFTFSAPAELTLSATSRRKAKRSAT